jgi:hypothetical protein
MAQTVLSVGAAFRPELMESDWLIINELRTACIQHEQRDTFWPFFQGCGECRGFIFGRERSDVEKQFSCCGCVVAMEMELIASGIRPPPNQPAILTQQPEACMSEAVFKMPERDARTHASRVSTAYLHHERSFSSHKHGLRNPSRQMITRARESKLRSPRTS